jgi:hypothetical protein
LICDARFDGRIGAIATFELAIFTANQMQLNMQSFSADHITLLVRVSDDAGNVFETHEHAGEFTESAEVAEWDAASA